MNTEIFALRLKPGQDPKTAIQEFAEAHDIRAGSVVSGVGSLKVAALRFADQKEATLIQGPLEIVSLTGTVSRFGSHLHIAVADGKGATRGGHLKEGSRVYTTVELTILEARDLEFRRAKDDATGYGELSVGPRTPGKTK